MERLFFCPRFFCHGGPASPCPIISPACQAGRFALNDFFSYDEGASLTHGSGEHIVEPWRRSYHANNKE